METESTVGAEDTEVETLREDIVDELHGYTGDSCDEDNPLNRVACEFDSSTRNNVSYTVSVRDCGTERHKLDMHSPEERYEFSISTTLEHNDKGQISGIKTMLYELLDNLFPEAEHIVNSDYPSGRISASYRATESEIMNAYK